jgi:hypothetical protein
VYVVLSVMELELESNVGWDGPKEAFDDLGETGGEGIEIDMDRFVLCTPSLTLSSETSSISSNTSHHSDYSETAQIPILPPRPGDITISKYPLPDRDFICLTTPDLNRRFDTDSSLLLYLASAELRDLRRSSAPLPTFPREVSRASRLVKRLELGGNVSAMNVRSKRRSMSVGTMPLNIIKKSHGPMSRRSSPGPPIRRRIPSDSSSSSEYSEERPEVPSGPSSPCSGHQIPYSPNSDDRVYSFYELDGQDILDTVIKLDISPTLPKGSPLVSNHLPIYIPCGSPIVQTNPEKDSVSASTPLDAPPRSTTTPLSTRPNMSPVDDHSWFGDQGEFYSYAPDQEVVSATSPSFHSLIT